jgi:hypothetical protein
MGAQDLLNPRSAGGGVAVGRISHAETDVVIGHRVCHAAAMTSGQIIIGGRVGT